MRFGRYVPFVFIFMALLICGWGKVGHAIINKAGAKDFPDRNILTPALI